MKRYNPEISTARISTEKLQDRRELLATEGRSGNREQQTSQPRKAEMLRITLALHLRGVQPRSAAYVARPAGRAVGTVQAPAVEAPPPPVSCGYSAAVARAEKAYDPKLHSVYA